MKKVSTKRKKKKLSLEDAENLSFTEMEGEVEDLHFSEVEKDNFCEGDFDYKDVTSIVKLF